MQNYYNNISTAKKVAFIDNISYSEAEAISRRFPFAICLTSRGNEGRTIWYNGEPYGLCKVSSKLITVNNNDEIGLYINSAGEIELYKKVTTNVFYIGDSTTAQSVLTSGTITSSQSLNTSTYSNLRNTWLTLPDTINFNSKYDETSTSNKAKFKLQKNDIIIIPSNYKLTLPLSEDNISNIVDNMFVLNSNSYTINDKSYKKYTIDQEYWNSTNDNVYFISLIEKIN